MAALNMLRVGACFAGYGGLELGLESVLPARTAWVSEIGAAPSRILAHRFPAAPNLGDITRVRWADVEPVDVVTGGFPCQDVSHAGKRAGLGPGTRTGLWARMLEAVDVLRPRLVLAENVRGLLSAPAASDVESCPWCMGGAGDAEPPMRALGAVLADLADVGYDAAWCGLRAADVGAPHGRFRVFVLAWPTTDAESLYAARPERTGDNGRRPQAPPRDDGNAPPDAGRLPAGWFATAGQETSRRPRGEPAGRGRASDSLTLLPTPVAKDSGNTPEDHLRKKPGRQVVTSLQIIVDHGLLDSGGQLLPTPRASDGPHGGPNQRGSAGDLMLPSAVLSSRFGAYAEAVERWEAVLGRPAPDPTEPRGRDGSARLSPAFVEWMMGLPAGWVTATPGVSANDALAALGNGVMPQQAAAALRRLLAIRARYA